MKTIIVSVFEYKKVMYGWDRLWSVIVDGKQVRPEVVYDEIGKCIDEKATEKNAKELGMVSEKRNTSIAKYHFRSKTQRGDGDITDVLKKLGLKGEVILLDRGYCNTRIIN